MSEGREGVSERARRVAAVRRLVEQAAAVDGVAGIGGHVLDGLDDPEAPVAVRPVVEDGELVAVAVGRVGDPAEVVVAPAHRRRGHGTALVTAALRDAGAVWAHGDLPAARALAQRLFLVRTRELLRMAVDRTQAWPEPVWPADVRLRSFVPGADDDEFLGVNARAFAWHPEQGRLDRSALRAEMRQEWFDAAGFLLAVGPGGRILGFHWTKVHAHGAGEIYVLGVDPASGRRGLGRPLALAGLRHLAGRGVTSYLLYAEGDNTAAVSLYATLGFATAATDVVYRNASR